MTIVRRRNNQIIKTEQKNIKSLGKVKVETLFFFCSVLII
jgi:hypothetical protein